MLEIIIIIFYLLIGLGAAMEDKLEDSDFFLTVTLWPIALGTLLAKKVR